MRVRIAATGLYTYPDVVVVCGQPRFEDEERDTLLNPTLIVEVLSPSTEDYDRGRRFAHYRSIPSLQVYLLVRQDRAHVELFTRQRDDRWVLWETDDLGATVDLSAIGATIALADVYDRVPGVSI
jgi:Uma2 family endonuclease